MRIELKALLTNHIFYLNVKDIKHVAPGNYFVKGGGSLITLRNGFSYSSEPPSSIERKIFDARMDNLLNSDNKSEII